MIRLLATVGLFLLLVGCGMAQKVSENDIHTPLDDGYQLFDLTRTALVLQAHYCRTADPMDRAFRLATLRALGVPIPSSGACTNVLSLVPTGALEDVDFEQAVEDQKRFQEASHGSPSDPRLQRQ